MKFAYINSFDSEAVWATHMHLSLDPVHTCHCQAEDRLRRDIHVLKGGVGVMLDYNFWIFT